MGLAVYRCHRTVPDAMPEVLLAVPLAFKVTTAK
jgi:hypothetical protein